MNHTKNSFILAHNFWSVLLWSNKYIKEILVLGIECCHKKCKTCGTGFVIVDSLMGLKEPVSTVLILLPQPLKYWNYRCTPPLLALKETVRKKS
jgi:hypothetical protein